MSIDLDIVVTLPRHAEPHRLEAVDRDLARNWRRFVESVRVHEDRHVAIERDRGERTRFAMLALADRRLGCDALEEAIERIWSEQQERADAQHQAFDDEDRDRIAELRAEISDEIEALEVVIAGVDRRLAALLREIEEIDRALAQIRERYPDLVLPEPDYSRHVDLNRRRSALVDEYNRSVDVRNASVDERNMLADRHNWTY